MSVRNELPSPQWDMKRPQPLVSADGATAEATFQKLEYGRHRLEQELINEGYVLAAEVHDGDVISLGKLGKNSGVDVSPVLATYPDAVPFQQPEKPQQLRIGFYYQDENREAEGYQTVGLDWEQGSWQLDMMNSQAEELESLEPDTGFHRISLQPLDVYDNSLVVFGGQVELKFYVDRWKTSDGRYDLKVYVGARPLNQPSILKPVRGEFFEKWDSVELGPERIDFQPGLSKLLAGLQKLGQRPVEHWQSNFVGVYFPFDQVTLMCNELGASGTNCYVNGAGTVYIKLAASGGHDFIAEADLDQVTAYICDHLNQEGVDRDTYRLGFIHYQVEGRSLYHLHIYLTHHLV